MDQQASIILGLGGLGGLVALIIVVFLQHRTITSVTGALQGVNNNPAFLKLAEGATNGIPQDVFIKILAALSAARAIDPNADQQALIDQIAALVKNVEPPAPAPATGGTPAPQ